MSHAQYTWSSCRHIFLHKNQKNYHSQFVFSWYIFSSQVTCKHLCNNDDGKREEAKRDDRGCVDCLMTPRAACWTGRAHLSTRPRPRSKVDRLRSCTAALSGFFRPRQEEDKRKAIIETWKTILRGVAPDDVFSTLVVWNTSTPAAVIQGGETLHRRIGGRFRIRSSL